MRKTIIPTFALLATGIAAFAQQASHEIDVHGGGGISTLGYQLRYGTQTPGYGGTAGLGYTYFFSNNVGLGLGVDLALYSATASLADRRLPTFDTRDKDGLPISITSTIRSYTETQQATYIHVPLHLQFQSSGKHKFYAQLNLASKVGIPLSATYSTSDVVIHNDGQYPGYASLGENIEEPRADGIGTFTEKSVSNGKLELDIAYTLAAEIGAKWRLSDSWSLYTGVYVDYSVTDIRKNANSSSSFIVPAEGNMTDQFTTASVLATQDFVDKAQLMAGGVKVRVAFGAGKRHGTSASAAEPIAIDTAAEAAKAEADRLAAAAATEAGEKEGVRRMLDVIAQLQTTISGFSNEQVDIPESARSKLDLTVKVLKDYPELSILIEGHTTNLGNPKKNLDVSNRRAEKAKAYIVSNGVDASRIYTRGRGATEPVVSDKSAQNKRKNSRLEIYVSNKK